MPLDTMFSIAHISTHTLTWSVTIQISPCIGTNSDFNSHAHVERDNSDTVNNKIGRISTHTLTWSVTFDK